MSDEIRHTHEPRATEIDVDVAITTTGRTLAVKVGLAARPGETDEQVAQRAVDLSHLVTNMTVADYAAAGFSFGKVEKTAPDLGEQLTRSIEAAQKAKAS